MTFVGSVISRMNWQVLILAFFLTINVSAEACAAPTIVGDKDQPHALCITDDLEHGKCFSLAVNEDCDGFMDVWSAVTEVTLSTPGMFLALASPARWQECAGVRLHRRLCVERC